MASGDLPSGSGGIGAAAPPARSLSAITPFSGSRAPEAVGYAAQATSAARSTLSPPGTALVGGKMRRLPQVSWVENQESLRAGGL